MDANSEILCVKAEQNNEIAKIAENKQYFDVAVSRYYYAIYQLMLAVVKHHNPTFKPDNKSSHKLLYDEFINYTGRKPDHYKLTGKQTLSLMNFYSLKDIRKDADYNSSYISKLKFDTFYRYFISMHDAIMEIIKTWEAM